MRKQTTLVNLNDVYRSLLLHSMMVGSNGNVSLPPNTPQYAAPMFMSGFPGLAYGTLQQPYQMASVAATTTPFTPQQSLAPPQSVAVTTTTLPPNAAQQSSPRSSHQSVSDSDAEDRNGSSRFLTWKHWRCQKGPNNPLSFRTALLACTHTVLLWVRLWYEWDRSVRCTVRMHHRPFFGP